MADRLSLQDELETLLGSRNVYFDPPESVKMKYDAIRYTRKQIENNYANDSVYNQNNCYELIVIYRDPDSDIPIKVSRLPKCRHDRHYVVDNLHHDVFTIYY
jgi:hypothetical protein